MEQEPNHQETRRKSLLGAALNIQYGPCSIAASELANAATSGYAGMLNYELEQWNNQVGRYAEYNHGRSRYVVSTMNFAAKHPVVTSHIGETSMFVVQDVHKMVELTTVNELKKRRFRRDIIETNEIEKVRHNGGDVWLAESIADGAVLLPIATFQTRTDGNCSYVQLGSEISDDSLFATQGDEQTERLKLIDELRLLLPREGVGTQTPLVAEFVTSERKRQAKQLSVAIGGHIGNLLEQTHRSYFNDHSVAVVQPNDETTYYDHVQQYTLSDDMCVVKITNESESSSHYIAGAISRGNVLTPVAEFYPVSNESRIVSAASISPEDQYKSYIALIALIDSERTSALKEFHKLTDSRMKPGDFLREMFTLSEQISETLKPVCEQQEKLARALGNKAIGQTYTGTVHDVYMETTIGSVEGSITVDRIGDIYQARILARPATLTEMDFGQILDFAYDPTEPLERQLPDGDDANDIARLVDGFSQQVTQDT